MSTITKNSFLAALLGFMLFGTAACNTMQGMGEDIQSGGESLEDTSEDVQDDM